MTGKDNAERAIVSSPKLGPWAVRRPAKRPEERVADVHVLEARDDGEQLVEQRIGERERGRVLQRLAPRERAARPPP